MASGYLEEIYNQANKASAAYFQFETEKKLLNILQKLDEMQRDLNELREDIKVFQACMLATYISEKSAELEIMSDELRNLASLEEKVRDIVNRKCLK